MIEVLTISYIYIHIYGTETWKYRLQLLCLLEFISLPCEHGSWGQHGVHLGPTGPRWAPCWPHESCYLGMYLRFWIHFSCANKIFQNNHWYLTRCCSTLSVKPHPNWLLWSCSLISSLISSLIHHHTPRWKPHCHIYLYIPAMDLIF